MNQLNRIQKLCSFYQEEPFVWDLCCDHGLIGESFFKRSGVQEVHFCDQVPKIIERLKNKQYSYIPKAELYYHPKPADQIHPSKNSYIILAGIGGETALKILNHLLMVLDCSSQIVVSTHTKYFWLVSKLREQNWEVVKEDYVFDKGKFYELLVLKKSSNKSIENLVPEYFARLKNEQVVQERAKEWIRYYQKAVSDPLRNEVLGFLISHYSDII